MANKPWENRLVEEFQTDASGMTPKSRKHEDYDAGSFTDRSLVNIRRNNMSTRISTRGPMSCQIVNSSSDQPYAEYYPYDDKSIKAKVKQRNSNYMSHSMQRNSTDSLQVHRKASPLSRAIARRSADCGFYSVDLCMISTSLRFDQLNLKTRATQL
ncbi:IQ calmodulin-binding motif [Datura stramonium]|uniref:IQ calmodulin-binding motif n=1 Tax=Datura stramonium TaxID=4076 RepID=A0ABS8RJ40_DATST|nr:IQ calmodulin-binding motif [Datura stramonium]